MESVPNTIQGLFIGSGIEQAYWLYWSTTFTDLLMTLLSASIFYRVAKTLRTKAHSSFGRWATPINIAKLMTMSLMAIIFLRVSMDTVILLTWQETSPSVMHFWQNMNEVF